MKKRIIIGLACVLALCFTLLGCAGGGKTDNAKNFIGTWEIDSMVSEGETVSSEDLDLMRSFGMNVLLTFSEDKTWKLDFMGEATTGTWEAKDAATVTLTIEGDKVDANLKDGKLSLEVEGSSLTFVHNDDAKASEPSALGGDTDDNSDGSNDSGVSDNSKDSDNATKPINKIIADDAICTIEVINAGVDFADDPGYNLKVTNNSNKTIIVSTDFDSFSVGGKMVDPLFTETIKPGKYAESFMYFSADELGGGVEKLVDVEGTISVIDDDSYETLATYDFVM